MTPRAQTADDAENHSEPPEAEHARGAASRFLADAEDEKLFEKSPHKTSSRRNELQPQGQR